MLKKYIMLDKSFSAYNFDIIYNIIQVSQVQLAVFNL